MVKRQPRGTGYNSADMGGADGWEWWSLQDQGNCTVGRLWRGPAPPVTEPYAGMTVGDCNACHTQVVANDYVWDTALVARRDFWAVAALHQSTWLQDFFAQRAARVTPSSSLGAIAVGAARASIPSIAPPSPASSATRS